MLTSRVFAYSNFLRSVQVSCELGLSVSEFQLSGVKNKQTPSLHSVVGAKSWGQHLRTGSPTANHGYFDQDSPSTTGLKSSAAMIAGFRTDEWKNILAFEK